MSLEPTHMMYWNIFKISTIVSFTSLNRHIWCIETQNYLLLHKVSSLEPTHMMYWNVNRSIIPYKTGSLEPTHMMYWNNARIIKEQQEANLNRHIWCIETWFLARTKRFFGAWTDTYDVLKQETKSCKGLRLTTWTDTYDVLKQLCSWD